MTEENKQAIAPAASEGATLNPAAFAAPTPPTPPTPVAVAPADQALAEHAKVEAVAENAGAIQVVKTDAIPSIHDPAFAAQQMAQIYSAQSYNVDDSEILYSRIVILQGLSPEVAQESPGYKAGQLVDNVSRDILSDFAKSPWLEGKVEPASLPSLNFLRFVPIFKLPSEFIHWKHRETEGKGWHFKTLDASDDRVRDGLWPPRGRWRPDPADPQKKSPPVTENINILGMVMDANMEPKTPYIVATFAKTNFHCGRRLVTACEQHKMYRMPYWGVCYFLYTQPKQFPKGTAYVLNVQRGVKTTFDNDRMAMLMAMASDLANPNTGRMKQERIINASFLDEGDAYASDEGDAAAGDTQIPF